MKDGKNKNFLIMGKLIIICVILSTFFNANAITQQKSKTSQSGSKLAEFERDDENVAQEFLNDLGGEVARKVEAQNPDLFPQNLSPLERARRLEFFLPRADNTGSVDLDLNMKAWQDLQTRKANQAGKSFSINGLQTNNLLTWN